jgi:hypothetical protein
MATGRRGAVLAISFLGLTSFLFARQSSPAGSPGKMPVKEVSIFKDGHAFVLHEGSLPLDASGNVMMDYLPHPVLGTFWAYTADANMKVSAVTAGQHRIVVERTALKLSEMLESNVGADVIVTEKPSGTGKDGLSYAATILSIPRRSSEELLATSAPDAAESLPVKGELILLKTADGVKTLPLDRVQDVVFKAAPKEKVDEEEFRNLLTLKLDGANRAPGRNANIGIVYLQKGLRWIPSYRVTIDGRGSATAKLQAMLVNDLADLAGVTANLVIGVPSFAFKDTLDPIALSPATPLSNYFQSSDRAALSNAIASQVVMTRGAVTSPSAPESGPEVNDSSQNEDLFLFTVKNVTLKKGQRLSLPVIESKMRYKDLYTLNLPFSPPLEVRGSLSMEQQTEIGRSLNEPRPSHKIRLTNSAAVPLTTAPALIVQDDQILSQGTMTYGSPMANVDLEIGRAIDIQAVRSETEISRTPNATRVNGEAYTDVRLQGSIKLTNYRKESVEVEVTREVLGRVSSASVNGRIEKLNAISEYPQWWRYYSWPYWWNHMNGIGRISWNVTLAPGQSIELTYEWQYYWR